MGVDDGVAQASSSSSGQPNEQRIRAERAAAAAAARLRGEVPLSPTGPASTQSGRDDVEDESDGDEAQAGAASRQSINSVQAANSTLPSVSNTQVEALAATLSTGATISAPNPAASSTPNDLVKSLSEQLECSICREIVFQPVSVLDCLHTFCGSCLIQWVSNHRSAPECPTCRSPARATKDSHQHNSLRDVLIRMDPSQDRTADEKEEMQRIYHPGATIDLVQAAGSSARDDRGQQDGGNDGQMVQATQAQQAAMLGGRQAFPMRPMVLLNPIDELNLLLRYYFPCPTCQPGNPYGYLCQHPIPDPRLMYSFSFTGPTGANAPPPIPRTPANMPRDHTQCFNCRRPNLIPIRDRREYPQDTCAICSEHFCTNLLGYCGPIRQNKAREFKRLDAYTMPPRQGLLTSTFNNFFGVGADYDSIGTFMPALFNGDTDRIRAFDVWLQKQKNMNLNDFYHAVVAYGVRNSPQPVVVGAEEQGLLRAPWQGVPGRHMRSRIRPTDWVCIICSKDVAESYARDWYNAELQRTPPVPGSLYHQPAPLSASANNSSPQSLRQTQPSRAAPAPASSGGGFFSSIKKGFSDIGDKFNEITADPPEKPPPMPQPLQPLPSVESFTDRQILRGDQQPKYPSSIASTRDHDGHAVFLAIYHHASGAQIPAKLCPTLKGPVRVAWEGSEYTLTKDDKYETFLENPAIHKWVRASNSTMPPTETPVQAGIERDGRTPLYFACAWHEGVRTPGYTGPNTLGARIPYGGSEVNIKDDYEVLVWRREAARIAS